jgi:hypothetical protein
MEPVKWKHRYGVELFPKLDGDTSDDGFEAKEKASSFLPVESVMF